MGRLNGKRTIVTGGASGIGEATARLFAREGAAVAILDINDSGGRRALEEIPAEGGRGIYIRCDVTQSIECRQAVDQVVEAFGGIDILVNGVGVIRRATVVAISEADWDRVMAVNVKSVYLLSKNVIPIMQASGGGAIVNISSGWGLVGGPQAVAYCAAKGAVVQMTRAMAIDHGQEGIRVNCICPGDTDTPMLRSEAQQLGQEQAAFMHEAAERPLQRVGQSQEIAEAILFLASESASFVTGTTLVVDGGGLAG